jgi:hypothetical protein
MREVVEDQDQAACQINKLLGTGKPEPLAAVASRIAPCAHTHPPASTPVLAERSTVAVKTKAWHWKSDKRVRVHPFIWRNTVPFENAVAACPSYDRYICCSLMQMLTPPPDDGVDSSVSMTLDAHDWAATLPQTDHVRFFRTTDWARTRLGPLKSWSPTLQLFASYVLSDSRPACLWWGEINSLTAIYNESYALLAASIHPKLMGSVFQDRYPDLWPSISEYFKQAKRTGTGVNYGSTTSTVVERNGYREEAFFSGAFVPVGLPVVEGFINTS